MSDQYERGKRYIIDGIEYIGMTDEDIRNVTQMIEDTKRSTFYLKITTGLLGLMILVLILARLSVI